MLFSLLSAGFRAKEQVCGTGQIKISASGCFLLWPTARLHTILLSICFQTLLFLWPWTAFWYTGLFLRNPIRVASSNKGCLQVVFSSLHLQTQLQQWWSTEFGDPNSGICPRTGFSLMLMLQQFAGLDFCFGLPWPWNIFMPACQLPVDNSPGESPCPFGFWPTCSANSFSLPFFVNILLASWALP